jgi:hypothetical protein
MVKEDKKSAGEYSMTVLAVILILVSFCFISQVFKNPDTQPNREPRSQTV